MDQRVPIIDTHTHLDDPAFAEDLVSVLESARAVGVRRFVNIAYMPERWETSRILRETHRGIEIVLGLHPLEAMHFDSSLERAFHQAIEEIQPIAIGEIGLDFSRSARSSQQQLDAFRAQLAIAAEINLPVVIHQRNAGDPVLAELDRWPRLAHIVLHSFDGDERLRDWATERGCFVGIGGLACKSASESLRELLKDVSPERLLLETDAPYLAPPGSNNRRNVPANLPRLARLLAPIWHFSGDDLCSITTRNAMSAFRLDREDIIEP